MATLTIISGVQTGVDRSAMDVAIDLNIPHAGWCPPGRKAEDGIYIMACSFLTSVLKSYLSL